MGSAAVDLADARNSSSRSDASRVSDCSHSSGF
jgi:hypothetical protein